MRKINFQTFKSNPGGQLKDLPFEVTMFGRPYAIVMAPNEKVAPANPEAGASSKFDWQKPEVCASCGKELPALIMVYHAHVVHGV